MEPNGTPAQGQQGQQQQQYQVPAQQQGQQQFTTPPAQQQGQPQFSQGQPQFQQPLTPQIQYAQIDSRTGTPIQQRQAAPQTQAVDQNVIAAQLRNDLAASFNLPPESLPTDYSQLLRITAGAYAIMNRQKEQQNQYQQPIQQPAQTQVPTTQQTPANNPLQEIPMQPGWQSLVTKDQQSGQWVPLHPNFQHVAQAANYNDGVSAARIGALKQGQLLPEQQKAIDDMMQERLQQEREVMRGQLFMEQHEKELYQTNPDGSRVKRINPVNMQYEDVPSELGIEMRAAADELRKSGALYTSGVDLANTALKWAKERLKVRQQMQQGQQQQQQQVPAQNKDLQDLLNTHKQVGTNAVANYNTTQAPYPDLRSSLRADLQNVPDNADFMTFAKTLGMTA